MYRTRFDVLDSKKGYFYIVEESRYVATMKTKKSYLGEFEELVLLAIIKLGSEAYGVSVRQTLTDVREFETSIGAVYTTLDRLEEKGFVQSHFGEATFERGGRAKKFFTVTGAGELALAQAAKVRQALSTEKPIAIH